MHSRLRLLGGAILVASALIMSSAASAQAAPPSPSVLKAPTAEQHQINVSATDGWQGNIWVPAGTWVNMQAPWVGQYWTVDYRAEANLPYVGAGGYRGEPVWGGNTTCKAVPEWPYGALLYRIGEGRPSALSGSFVSVNGGYLSFSINDLEQCQGDNAGSLPVTVVIG
jgi:hypothetical protein